LPEWFTSAAPCYFATVLFCLVAYTMFRRSRLSHSEMTKNTRDVRVSYSPRRQSTATTNSVAPTPPFLADVAPTITQDPIVELAEHAIPTEDLDTTSTPATGTASQTKTASAARWEAGTLPACADRNGVSDEERAMMVEMSHDPAFSRGFLPHDGLLVLGTAREAIREMAKDPQHASAQRKRIFDDFLKALDWRDQIDADGIWRNGLSERDELVQPMSYRYGTTRDGAPLAIENACNWIPAIKNAFKCGMSPEEFGRQRVYWYEHNMDLINKLHAQGMGNGQFLSIIDFGTLSADLTLAETRRAWPYLKSANFVVSANYGGTGRRIYLARLPRTVVWGWKLVKKFLPKETQEKVAVVSPRPTPAKVEHYQYPNGPYGGTMFDADALPACLGGTLESYDQRPAEFFLHWGRGAGPGKARLA
jgi:hypothetical protein